MGQLVEASPKLRLAHPVGVEPWSVSNRSARRREPGRGGVARMSGEAVFLDHPGRGRVLPARALVNHRNHTGDVRAGDRRGSRRR